MWGGAKNLGGPKCPSCGWCAVPGRCNNPGCLTNVADHISDEGIRKIAERIEQLKKKDSDECHSDDCHYR